MATYYIDPVNGTDSQAGGAPVKKLGCTVSSTSITVPDATGLVAGMKVFAVDMENSGGYIPSGTTISSIVGTTVTISAAATSSASDATIIFSPAKKLLSSFASSLLPGDSVRFKQSQAPVSTGLTSSWVAGSCAVGVTSLPVVEIDACEDAFTAYQAGVTVGTETSIYQYGSRAVTIGGSTTGTGVLAYKALTSPVTLNSAYTRISFLAQYAGTDVGTIRLNLCSDSLGQTPLYSVTIPYVSYWSYVSYSLCPIVSDVGAMSGTVNSISVERMTSGSSSGMSLTLDNIVVCKPASDSSAICHRDLVAKSATSEFYLVRSLSADIVSLQLDTTQGYLGTTESSTLYKRAPLEAPAQGWNLSVSGTEASRIVVSGGWDNVDMSTQVSETILRPPFRNTLYSTVSGNYVTVSKVGFADSASGPALTVSGSNVILENTHIYGRTVGNGSYGGNDYGSVTISGYNVKLKGLHIISPALIAARYNYSPYYNGTFVISAGRRTYIEDCVFMNGIAWFPSAVDGLVVKDTVFNGGPLFFDTTASGKRSVFNRCTIKNLGSGVALRANSNVPGAYALFRDCIFDIAINVANVSSGVTVAGGWNPDAEVRFQNINQVAGDHKIFKPMGVISTDLDANRHTPSGISWGITPIGSSVYNNSVSPMALPLAKVFVTMGQSFTASVWVMRTGGDITAGIRVAAGQLPGMSESSAVSTQTAGEWVQVNLTFTPPASGVVEIEAFAYGSTVSTAYFDDFSAA